MYSKVMGNELRIALIGSVEDPHSFPVVLFGSCPPPLKYRSTIISYLFSFLLSVYCSRLGKAGGRRRLEPKKQCCRSVMFIADPGF